MPSVLLAFPTVDFTCAASADPGDALFISFQAESTTGAPQGAMADCLGQAAPVIDGAPVVRSVYSVTTSGGGTLEFGCTGNGGVAFGALARNVENFKVFFAWDADADARAALGGIRHTVRGSQIVTATFLNNLWAQRLVANPNSDDWAEINPWNQVVAVHVCLVVASAEANTTPDFVSHYKPCPTTPAEAATGMAEVTVNDGVARRTINQVYTLRTRGQANAGTDFVP
jgi:hypothetical protein